MAYVNEGIDQRAEVMVDTVDSVVYWPKKDGQNVIPDSATATIYGPSGGVLVPTAPVVPGSAGQLAVSQAWPMATYYLAEDFVVLWAYVLAGVTFTDRTYFDVVKTKLLCPISDDDLESVYPDLESHLQSVNETDASKFIRRGWSTLLDSIRTAGRRPSLILDRARLVNPAVHISLYWMCNELARSPDDLWSKRMDMHYTWYDNFMKGLGMLRYDLNEDAVADKSEESRVTRKRAFV